MNINRYNYEEYFLLYTDNELNAAERKAVEQFVQENTDLEPELLLLTQTTFIPDDNIVFSNKELLMQQGAQENFIHADNCEQLFILYADDELTNNEKAAVEQFVYNNSHFQESFELMQSIKLTPDLSVTFSDKKSLYRHEQNKKPVVFTWWRMVAAAILFFTGFVWLNKTPSLKPSNQIAKAESKPVKNANILLHNAPGGAANNLNPPGSLGQIDSITVSSKIQLRAKKGTREEKRQESNAESATSVGPHDIAYKNAGDKRIVIKKPLVAKLISEPNNPVDNQIGNVIQEEPVNRAIAYSKIDQPEQHIKTIANLPQIKNDINSTKNYSNETVLSSSGNDVNVILANIPVDRKNSLRGLFRKASRLIDKTTSYRPAKRSGLSIGNIEIAFQ